MAGSPDIARDESSAERQKRLARERQRRQRRRRALGAVSLRADVPSDIMAEIRLRGVDPTDPAQLGELIDDLLAL